MCGAWVSGLGKRQSETYLNVEIQPVFLGGLKTKKLPRRVVYCGNGKSIS
jgi:hypothetical protein